MPTFSIVIPTLGDNLAYLMPCLQAIKDTCKTLDYEIIVVGNAPTETSRSILSNTNLKIKTLFFEENRGYSAACNAGSKLATGKYLIFLNDDTLPCRDWLHLLHDAYVNAAKKLNLDSAIGAVGPMSNNISGVQRVKDVVPMQARELYAGSLQEQYRLTAVLIGFCFFISKELFDKLGGFDAKLFPLGCEDNDICTRIMKEGYHLLAVGKSFVFHHGSVTMKQFPSAQMGCRDLDILAYKHSNTNNRICVGYRVKIKNDYFLNVFERSLTKSLSFADEIIVLDDGSLTPLQEQIAILKDPKITYRRYERPFEERRDRNELLDFVREKKCDWFLALDADEIMEEKFDRKYAERLMRPLNPHTFGYSFHEYTFWNSEDHFTFNSPWDRMSPLRMWRVQPNRRILHGAKSTLHCEHIPVLPLEAAVATSIGILHYGYVRPEDRLEKYNWYEKVDTDKRRELIGFDDYRHLIDENSLKLRKYRSDTKISVTTMSNEDMVQAYEWLRYIGTFADEICICDTGMAPRAKQLLEYFGAKIVPGDNSLGFAVNRNISLSKCTQDWILQLDMDEKVMDTTILRRMLDADVPGYIFTVRNIIRDGRSCISETIRLFRRSLGLQYFGMIHETVDKIVREKRLRVYRSVTDILHFGYLQEPEKLKAKMKRYFEMNIKELMNGATAKTYYNLALHLDEVPEFDLVSEMLFKKSIELDPKFIQPYKELMLTYLRRANLLANKMKQVGKDGLNNTEDSLCKRIADETSPFIDKERFVPEHILEYLNENKISLRSTATVKDPMLRDLFIFEKEPVWLVKSKPN